MKKSYIKPQSNVVEVAPFMLDNLASWTTDNPNRLDDNTRNDWGSVIYDNKVSTENNNSTDLWDEENW